ncbi:MAG: hypothetical protein ACTSXT_08165 [Candidatus Helarchaeota archaeon]
MTYLTDFFKNMKWFIQRGKRGWADCDVLDFDYYLSKIISEGINKLKIDGYSLVDEEELDVIIYAFQISQRIAFCDVIYVTERNRKKVEEMYKNVSFVKVLSKGECEKVRKGWNLFRKYFHNLWS